MVTARYHHHLLQTLSCAELTCSGEVSYPAPQHHHPILNTNAEDIFSRSPLFQMYTS